MKRAELGRDLSLTVRMAIVCLLIASFYLAATALVVAIVVSDPADARVWFVPLSFLLLLWGHYRSSEKLLLRAAGGRTVSKEDAPALHSTVERLCGLADLPKPRIVLIPSDARNAFAGGRRPGDTVVAVTDGLLERLEPREVEAVVAHELTHLANRDAFVMTFACFFALLGAAMSRRRFAGRDFAEEAPVRDFRDRVGFAIVKPFALLLYAVSLVLMLAVSRYREYAADRGAALLTGAPEQVMSALQKLSEDMGSIPARDLRATGLNAFFIVPAGHERRRFGFLMDHPPLDKRLERLAELASALGRPAA
jgi:heat shock protein HtpX